MLLRTKPVLHFLVVVLITGVVATAVGVLLIGDRIVRQAQNKVKSIVRLPRSLTK